MPNIAKVAVEIALDREFDYKIPDELISSVKLGTRVLVPFGRTFTRGYVVGLADRSEIKNLKIISSLIGTKPLINENMLKLARWISDYYVAAFEQAIRSLLPCAVRHPKAKFRRQNMVNPVPEKIGELNMDELRGRFPKQARALELLLKTGGMFVTDLVNETGILSSSVKTLARIKFTGSLKVFIYPVFMQD